MYLDIEHRITIKVAKQKYTWILFYVLQHAKPPKAWFTISIRFVNGNTYVYTNLQLETDTYLRRICLFWQPVFFICSNTNTNPRAPAIFGGTTRDSPSLKEQIN
jgi:hypothetical protein